MIERGLLVAVAAAIAVFGGLWVHSARLEKKAQSIAQQPPQGLSAADVKRATDLFGFFLASRRPAGWGVWAEGIASDPRKVKFVGDIPHAWVGSDFIRSLSDLFAIERESDGALVLAAGVPAAWFDGFEGPVGVARLGTPYGPISWKMRRESQGFRVTVEGGITVPPGGIVLRPPLPPGDCEARIDGEPVPCANGEVVLRKVPAEVLFGLARAPARAH